MKTYKLNKTFENSAYPIAQELSKLRLSTKKSIFNIIGNISAAFFSGVGTSILFQEECLPKLFNLLFQNDEKQKNTQDWGFIILYIIAIVVVFISLFMIGIFLNKVVNREKSIGEIKKSESGREELLEVFHKSIINNIATGLSFVDKADENKYQTDVDRLYLLEALYYFTIGKIDIDKIGLFETRENRFNVMLVERIGKQTLLTTLVVFLSGVDKVYINLPQCSEKSNAKGIRESLKDYINYLKS